MFVVVLLYVIIWLIMFGSIVGFGLFFMIFVWFIVCNNFVENGFDVLVNMDIGVVCVVMLVIDIGVGIWVVWVYFGIWFVFWLYFIILFVGIVFVLLWGMLFFMVGEGFSIVYVVGIILIYVVVGMIFGLIIGDFFCCLLNYCFFVFVFFVVGV